MTNYFKTLNEINVNEHTEKKNNLTYLSWAWAWGEVKKIHPDANYTVYENADGWNYFTDGKTCWVKTGVTVNNIEHIEYLPVMDFKNKSIPVENVTSFDVNKTIQRSLTKACARHGLGLYIYAGEDLPEGEETPKKERTEFEKDASKEKAQHTRIMNKAVAAQDESLVKPVEQKKPLTERIINAKKFLDEQTPETIAQVKRSTIDSMRALIAELKEKDFLSDADILEAKFNALIGLDDNIPY